MNASSWAGKRVLLTGHTGFKGAWLALWLQRAGAEVTGFALDPEPGSLFEVAGVADGLRHVVGDVRDADAVERVTREARPEVVLHLAAQALVRPSYEDPVGTYATNVMGTVHVLDAARRSDDLAVALVVTSDKCYENREWVWGYREDEAMGGKDPYSSSKGCAELVAHAFRSSYFGAGDGPRVASARAGNVIGGGDVARDRLVPDLVRAAAGGTPARVRNPRAVRPWQHVLNCLSGYLLLCEQLQARPELADGWNFGPEDADVQEVAWIADRLCERWGEGASWTSDPGPHPHEAGVLRLDSSKARTVLGWRPRWTLGETLDRIVDWHKAERAGEDLREVSLRQLDAFDRAEAPAPA